MSKPPVILITGAAGFIGSHLVEHFHKKGWVVIAVVHRAPPKSSDGVLYYHWDIAQQPDEEMLAGVDYLVHCAYVKYDNNKDADRINIEGTRQLLELSRKSGVKRNVFLSSMSAREDALSHYGRQKFEIEKLFRTSNDTVIRPGLVLGNGGLFSETANFIRKKRIVPLIDEGKQPLQTVYIDDVIAAIEAAIQKNLQGVFTIAETVPVQYHEFYRGLVKMLKLKARFLPVPSWVLSTAITVADAIGIKIPVSKENLLGLKNLKFTDTRNDLARLGITARTWKESLQILEQKGNEHG